VVFRCRPSLRLLPTTTVTARRAESANLIQGLRDRLDPTVIAESIRMEPFTRWAQDGLKNRPRVRVGPLPAPESAMAIAWFRARLR
jgi:hypothetical protein